MLDGGKHVFTFLFPHGITQQAAEQSGVVTERYIFATGRHGLGSWGGLSEIVTVKAPAEERSSGIVMPIRLGYFIERKTTTCESVRSIATIYGPDGSNDCRAQEYRRENTMSNEQMAPETKGVTVKSLATVDLGPEIEGMIGRQLRMRMVTIEPGGVFGPIHNHKDRPGTVYILQGTITDHRNGVATDYGPGVGWPRIGTPHTGLRTEERLRQWRSRSI